MAPNLAHDDPDWTKQNVVKKDGQWTIDGRPTVSVKPSWNENPSNTPSHSFIGLHVTMPVDAASAPHRHGGAAVAATVIQGSVLNQMICPDGKVTGPKIYKAGESWYEPPGCHHVRSENVGDEEAQFIASFVIERKKVEELGILAALVQYDADQEEGA